MNNIFDNKILVDELLNNNGFEKTEKIYICLPDGTRQGPFIKKSFLSSSGLGNSYEQIFTYCKSHKKHPNIPAILDVNYNNDEYFVIEEFVDGLTLDKFLKENTYSWKIVEAIFKQLCGALIWLHESIDPPIIHRDIKPQNIMIISDGNNIIVKLIDFGIARNMKDKSDKDTKVFGTVGFAPPEQFGFKQTDKRSDIYSLGKVLSYLIDCNNWNSNEDNINVDKYQRIIDKCTSFDPDNRYKNVYELRYDFSHPSKFHFKFVDTKLFHVFSMIWNVTLTCFLFLALAICTLVIYLPDSNTSLSELSNGQKMLFSIVVNLFILIPIWYIALIKSPLKKLFKWFPRTNFAQNIILIIVCAFFVIFLSLIAIYCF